MKEHCAEVRRQLNILITTIAILTSKRNSLAKAAGPSQRPIAPLSVNTFSHGFHFEPPRGLSHAPAQGLHRTSRAPVPQHGYAGYTTQATPVPSSYSTLTTTPDKPLAQEGRSKGYTQQESSRLGRYGHQYFASAMGHSTYPPIDSSSIVTGEQRSNARSPLSSLFPPTPTQQHFPVEQPPAFATIQEEHHFYDSSSPTSSISSSPTRSSFLASRSAMQKRQSKSPPYLILAHSNKDDMGKSTQAADDVKSDIISPLSIHSNEVDSPTDFLVGAEAITASTRSKESPDHQI